jgi:hypothetical protein
VTKYLTLKIDAKLLNWLKVKIKLLKMPKEEKQDEPQELITVKTPKMT